MKYFFFLDDKMRYMDCLILVRNSQEAMEVGTISCYDFINCRFNGEGDTG